MALIGTRSFKGEIPRLEPYLLGDTNAQRAIDCDFANGSLKPLRDGFLLRNMVNNPVRGIYTEDGINFYTWVAETWAFQSPVIDDTFNRMYYLTPSEGIFRVASKLGMAFNGPSPSAGNTWRAGVPRPTVAPTLSVYDNITNPGQNTLPDYPSYSVTAEAWWEDSAGKSYNRGAVTLTAVKVVESYTFPKPTAPTPPEGETETYKLAAKMVFTNTASNTEIMSATMKIGSTGRSNALPGSVEFSLEDVSGSTTGRITLKWGIAETRAYTYTYRNTWQEESAPSPASTISLTYIQSVRLVLTPGDFTGYRPFDKYQIYRTYGANSAYLPLTMISTGPEFADGFAKPDQGGEALQSTNWTPAPTGLQGLDLSPNGWFVAFKGNTLYMSEPHRPHAWPYNMTFPKNIRGIKVAQQSIVVTAADGVYIVAGAHPSAAQQVKLSTPQAGIAQRSMANIDGAVAYASNDGFVLVNGSSATPELGQKLFDRTTWRQYFDTQLIDASMRFSYHDGALVSTSSTNITNPAEMKGFLLRLDEDVGNFTRLTARYDATFLLPVADSLYYSDGSAVYQFRGGSPLQFDWWSKDFIFPMQETFGAGYVRCTGSVDLEVYADGVLVATKTGLTTGHFRLAGNMPRKLRWSFRLTGAGEVYEFFLARSMMELQRA